MRVISGSARGRRLKEPVGETIRPTSDKVKEAIFTIIQFDIESRRVLDLFAGTGQLGIEALSRGAASVVFVDSSRDSVKLINDNLRHCKFSDQAAVYTTDALSYLEYDEKFDVIFVDAPYETQLASKALLKIIEFDKLNINGIIIFELKTGTIMPGVTLPYELIKEYKYGSTTIFKLTRRE